MMIDGGGGGVITSKAVRPAAMYAPSSRTRAAQHDCDSHGLRGGGTGGGGLMFAGPENGGHPSIGLQLSCRLQITHW